MARNRMIKPEFWASETLMRISRDSRLLFIGLWNFCDDYGFCLGAPRRVLGDVFPVDESVTEANIKKWLTELIEVNVVIPLEYKSKKLLFIKSWGEHQTVQHKSKRSFIDTIDLEQVIKDTLDSHETLMRNYLDSHVPKRKKKEKEKDKVKEESNKGVFTPPTIEEFNKFISEDLRDYNLDSNQIFNYYNDADWHDSKGNKVKNWKQKIRGVWCKEENKKGSQASFNLSGRPHESQGQILRTQGEVQIAPQKLDENGNTIF